MPNPAQLSPSAALVDALRDAGCVFADEEAAVLASVARTPHDLASMVARRTAGMPLEHVVGWASFCGVRVVVRPGVFVPRVRTEFLVDLAVACTQSQSVVVDMCCGSGALGAAVEALLPGVDLYAVDIDPAALRCARLNLPGRQVYEGDLFDPLPALLRSHVDVLVANVPYVPSDEVRLLPTESRLYERRIAVDGGADGLDLVRRVSAAAPQWLAPHGHLLFETGEHQATRAASLVAEAGLLPRVVRSDDQAATVVIGAKTAAARRTQRSGWPPGIGVPGS